MNYIEVQTASPERKIVIPEIITNYMKAHPILFDEQTIEIAQHVYESQIKTDFSGMAEALKRTLQLLEQDEPIDKAKCVDISKLI